MLRAVCFCLFGGLLVQACHEKTSAEKAKQSAAVATDQRKIRTDIAGLAELINVPSTTLSARWEHRTGHGGAFLAAVMTIEPTDVQNILKTSRKLDVQTPTDLDDETARLLMPSKMAARPPGSGLKLEGVSVDPSLFVNDKKSAFLNGKAVVLVGEGLVLISLYTL